MSVLALKLGRSDRARQIVQSHTGSIAGDNWVYELAFAEHGIVSACDVDDLFDRAQLLAQLPAERRSAIGRIAIITTSGGVAALATDLADSEGVELPTLEELAPWVRERVPGDTVNPLDLTGFVMSQPEVMRELFDRYAGAVDALVLAWWLGEGDEAWSTTLLGPFAAAAVEHSIPFVVSPVEATSLGPWVDAWRERGLIFTRGLRSLYRATSALETRPSYRAATSKPDVAPAGIPPPLVSTPAGPIVRFDDAMRLLSEAGLPIAPYCVLGEHDDPSVAADLGPRLVAKLADVPHRTESGAVMVDVAAADLPGAVDQLRRLAQAEGLPVEVAVQPMVPGFGEAFAGVQARSDLGPLVLLGLGAYPPLKWQKRAVLEDCLPAPATTHRRELVTRLLKGRCEWCQQRAPVQAHQVRKLADLGTPGPAQPGWATLMARMRRKTLIVCAPCHQLIHDGKPAAICTS